MAPKAEIREAFKALLQGLNRYQATKSKRRSKEFDAAAKNLMKQMQVYDNLVRPEVKFDESGELVDYPYDCDVVTIDGATYVVNPYSMNLEYMFQKAFVLNLDQD
jgi:hypothetical protein